MGYPQGSPFEKASMSSCCVELLFVQQSTAPFSQAPCTKVRLARSDFRCNPIAAEGPWHPSLSSIAVACKFLYSRVECHVCPRIFMHFKDIVVRSGGPIQ